MLVREDVVRQAGTPLWLRLLRIRNQVRAPSAALILSTFSLCSGTLVLWIIAGLLSVSSDDHSRRCDPVIDRQLDFLDLAWWDGCGMNADWIGCSFHPLVLFCVSVLFLCPCALGPKSS